MDIISPGIEDYILNHSTKESPLLDELITETHRVMKTAAKMICGPIVARLLIILVKQMNAKRVLEIGTFTGYSALSMAEGLSSDGKIISLEIDPKIASIAESFFKKSPYHQNIELRLGPALDSLVMIKEPIDFAFIDADKKNYINYFNVLLPKISSGGMLVFDNALWGGEVLNPKDPESEIIARLNEQIINEQSVENVLLPVRDGVNIVFKK